MNDGKNNKRYSILKWGSIIVLLLSIIIIYVGMSLPNLLIMRGKEVDVMTHTYSDTLILVGSMLFGISGGMLTNIFTVYDTKYLDDKFSNIETKIDTIYNKLEMNK